VELLEGKAVNLRVMEKEDLPLFAEWYNNPEFMGEAIFPTQRSVTDTEKAFLEPSPLESKGFIIEKKDGTKIGTISHFNMLSPVGKLLEIGYALIPSERGKGYYAEAVQLMVDYLFLSKETPRIQSLTLVKNVASQSSGKSGLQKRGHNAEMLSHSRTMVRLCNLQHPQRRMERTKNANKENFLINCNEVLSCVRATLRRRSSRVL
jgi:RimJ/RimL family protein N-acetyltransferase